MSRNYVRVCIAPEILANMLVPSLPGVWTHIDTGLPRDARHVGGGYDWTTNQFYIVMSHPDFPEVPEGETIPTFRGVQISTFRFDSPATEKDIAALNEQTLTQIKIEENLNQQRWAQCHGEILPILDLKNFDPRQHGIDLTKMKLVSNKPREMDFNRPNDGDPVIIGG